VSQITFAEHANEAWSKPSSIAAHTRAAVRSLILRGPGQAEFASQPVIRCFYGHAVFPEHADALRTFVSELSEVGEFVDSDRVEALLMRGEPPQRRYFHLSFDDGFANVFEEGGRVLEELRIPYTMFIATDLVGKDTSELAGYFRSMPAYRAPIRPLSWEQLREAANMPMAEIGCHTRTHSRLSAISKDLARLTDEIDNAKAILEHATGKPCRSFAWPYGTLADIDDHGFAAIRAAGFSRCFSAVRGRVDPGKSDVMAIPRHQVEFHWPRHELRAWARGYRES
jgi:peptidoglycan/xylan/chitin deacetylase (PgdA/CDA1 family)